MITSAELALLRGAIDGAKISDIDRAEGNPIGESRLKSYLTLPISHSAPFFYDATNNTVYVKQNGVVLRGYDFSGANVVVMANNVTINDCTFNDESGWYSVIQEAGYTGMTVKNSTFNGGDNKPFEAFVASKGVATITHDSFFDTPTWDVAIAGGTVSDNYFSGGGYESGAHADAIVVTSTTAPVAISGNFIDWTNNANAAVATNEAVRITTEGGNTSNVTVDNNIILGGGYTVDAGNAGTGTFSNINIDNNYIGFGRFGAFYSGRQSGVTEAGNDIVDYTNPAYSAQAWVAYLADGIITDHLVISQNGANIAGEPTGTTTLYGDGTVEHMTGTSNETVFIGGYGTQYMWGGVGKNIFKYLSIAESTIQHYDEIGNFHASQDLIDLHLIDANLTKAGLQKFTFIGSNAFSGAGGQVRFVQDAATNETYVEADLVGDSQPDLYIQIGGLQNLTAANFALTAAQSAADMAVPLLTVKSVAANPASGELVAGQTATLTVNFNETATVTGWLELLLNDGGVAKYNAAQSSATSAAFDYAVGAESTIDLTVSGIEFAAGSAIVNLAGQRGDLAGAGGNLGLQVNTTHPGSAGPSGGNYTLMGSTDLELLGSSIAHIVFAPGAAGELFLDDSQGFSGTIYGLAPSNSIDLADIAYVAGKVPGYTANSANAGGELSIGHGTHMANIALIGSYLAGGFATASDGHGGTLLTDPMLAIASRPIA